jgi:ATP-dependent Zn protease
MVAWMDVCMGGRVAEELIFGEDNVTSGASSDIQSATRVARAMVTKYGFSDDCGIVYYGGETGQNDASGTTRSKIDEEVKRLTSASYERAKALLKKYSKEHILLAETLLEYETLTGDEVRELVLKGKKPKRPVVNTDNGGRGDQAVVAKKKSERKSRLAGLADKIRGANKDDGAQ